MKHGEMGTRKGMCLTKRVGTKCLQGQELYCHSCFELGCEFTCLRGQLCDWCKKKRKGKKPKTQTTSSYHFGRYQFLLDCTIKALLIDLLIANQILQVL